MNTYGSTKCPECKADNNLYRPIENILPVWDETSCWNCKANFLHSVESKKVNKGDK